MPLVFSSKVFVTTVCFSSYIGKNCCIIHKLNFYDSRSYYVNYIIFLLIIDIVVILHCVRIIYFFSHILCFVFSFFVDIIVVILCPEKRIGNLLILLPLSVYQMLVHFSRQPQMQHLNCGMLLVEGTVFHDLF